MLFSSLWAMLKLSKTTSPQKLFPYDCMTLYRSGVPAPESDYWCGHCRAQSIREVFKGKGTMARYQFLTIYFFPYEEKIDFFLT